MLFSKSYLGNRKLSSSLLTEMFGGVDDEEIVIPENRTVSLMRKHSINFYGKTFIEILHQLDKKRYEQIVKCRAANRNCKFREIRESEVYTDLELIRKDTVELIQWLYDKTEIPDSIKMEFVTNELFYKNWEKEDKY